MMPFSILRPWFLGSLSWALLAGAIYCGWLAAREYRRQPQPRAVLREQAQPREQPARLEENARNQREPATETAQPAIVPSPSQALSPRFWAYLSAALALVGWNFGGFLPVRWMLSSSEGPVRDPISPTKTIWVDRPDGSRLHVQIYGDANAPTLLLTHGWSLDVTSWDYSIRQLAKRWRVVTWDLPGLGRSTRATDGDQSLEKMAHDLNAVLQQTSTKYPVVLAGHSIGGMITQVFHRLHRDQIGTKVQGLALLQTTYVNPLRTCFAAPLATALEWPLVTPFNYLTIALAPWVWLSNLQSYLNGSLHISTRLSSFSGKQSPQQLEHAALLAVKAWPAVMARGNLAMQRFEADKTLTEIEVPVLVLSGKHDRMTLPSASEHMQDVLPQDFPFQLQAGHLGIWECPDEFCAALTEFMLRVTTHDNQNAKLPSSAISGKLPPSSQINDATGIVAKSRRSNDA